MTDSKVEAWRKDGKHLPSILRDFHDQKDLFKALHETVNVEAHSYAGKIDWVSGQCYVIDLFLWFMAAHGYTLQRSRTNLPFTDISKTVSSAKEDRDAVFSAALNNYLANIP